MKYEVFAGGERGLVNEDGHRVTFPTKAKLEEGSFFVLRSSDVFGSAALYAYAHLIQTGLELNRLRPVFSDEECARLEASAEQVIEVAKEWQMRGDVKIPD